MNQVNYTKILTVPSAAVAQVQSYVNVCMNRWQWCIDSILNGDAGATYAADGTSIDGGEDLGLMAQAVGLLLMLVEQGLTYIDASGSAAVMRPGNLPNGNNTLSLAVYGTTVSDMTLVATTWHIGWRERITPLLQMTALIADGIALIGGITCAATAGVGCAAAAAATGVAAVANLGTAALNCPAAGQQLTCAFAIGGFALNGLQIAAAGSLGRLANAGTISKEFVQFTTMMSTYSGMFYGVVAYQISTGDGGEVGTMTLVRVTAGAG